jgi:hypothetical protein
MERTVIIKSSSVLIAMLGGVTGNGNLLPSGVEYVRGRVKGVLCRGMS